MDNYILAYYQKIQDGSEIVGKWIRMLYEKIVHGIESGEFLFDQNKANKCIRFFEKFVRHAPNATGYFSVYKFDNGNILRGNLKSIPEISKSWAPWGGLNSVYSADVFSDTVTNPFPQNFVACTEEELKDAAYLRSLGFPIVVG